MIKSNSWRSYWSGKLSGRAILDLLIELLYLATVFLIPIYFAYWPSLYNIFEFAKSALLQILTSLLLLATGWRLIYYPVKLRLTPSQFFKKYWLVPTIFITGLGLLLIASINPARSFYGLIERQQGLVSYLFYFIWFILVSFNVLIIDNSYHLANSTQPLLADSWERRARRIIITAVLASLVVSVYGILQILNIDFLSWPEPPFLTHRTISSFGQPNFLASWLLLVIPLSWYLFQTSRKFWWKFFYVLTGLLQVSCFFFTGSRGGLVALLVGVVIFLTYKLWSWNCSLAKRLVVLLVVVVGLSGLLLIFNYFSGGRITSLSNLAFGSVAARVNLYRAATDAISQRPLLGYGAENGWPVFIKYYAASWGAYGDVGQSADRAHNLIFDILLSGGLVALGLYLGLYAFFYKLARASCKINQSPELARFLALGLTMYLVSLLFSFTVVAGEVYLWLFMGLLVVQSAAKNQDWVQSLTVSSQSVKFSWIKKIVVILVLVLVTGSWIIRVFHNVVADYYFNCLYDTLVKFDYPTALILADDVRNVQPNQINQQTYDNFLADKLSDNFPSSGDAATRGVVLAELRYLDQALSATDVSNLLVKAKANRVLHAFSVAEEYINDLISLTPHWPLAYIEKGDLESAQGSVKSALVAYNLALLNLPSMDDPGLNEPHRQIVFYFQYLIHQKIALVFAGQNNWVAAAKHYELAYRSYPADFTLFKKIADTYYRRGDLSTAISYVQRGFSRGPQDYNWPLSLAILYQESNNWPAAKYYLTVAAKLAPDNTTIIKLTTEWAK